MVPWRVGTVILTAALGAFAAVVIPRLGLGRVVWDHQPGECHFLEGIEHGSEDIEVLSDDTVLITSGLRYTQMLGSNILDGVKGQILWFDFKSTTKPPVPVKIEGNINPNTFSPHGISSWRDHRRGVTSIYVVNHPLDEDHDTVEKFTWDANTKVLTRVCSISDPSFRLTNGLVAVGDDQFYISNIIYHRHDYIKLLETFTFREWGEVVYFDGYHGKIVAEGLGGPNGVAISPDEQLLYVAMYFTGELHVYDRQADNSLNLRNVIAVGSSLDNIQVDPHNGDLWLGSHPVAWKILLYDDGGVQTAPSHVLRLKIKYGELIHMEEIFADSGRRLSASSVAAYRNGSLLIGTVYQKAMFCQVAHLQ